LEGLFEQATYIVTGIMFYYIVHIRHGFEDFTMQECSFSIKYLTVTITVNTIPSYDEQLRLTATVFLNT